MGEREYLNGGRLVDICSIPALGLGSGWVCVVLCSLPGGCSKTAWRSNPLSMATGKDLIEAVRCSLEADGELGEIKAAMRKTVMKLLEGSHKSSREKRPKSPHEVFIINELVREYLNWMGYKYTASVLVSECELAKQPLDRSFLSKDLGTVETDKTKELPLLFSMVETFKEINDL